MTTTAPQPTEPKTLASGRVVAIAGPVIDGKCDATNFASVACCQNFIEEENLFTVVVSNHIPKTFNYREHDYTLKLLMIAIVALRFCHRSESRRSALRLCSAFGSAVDPATLVH